MIKRMLTMMLALALVLGAVPGTMATEATEQTEETWFVRGEFECGDDLTWAYADGVLTVTGTGAMDDYESDAPWAAYKEELEAVILTGGVTYIGARAFRDYDNLKSVDFGTKLTEIGEEAFRSCDGLTEIELPSTFKIFGPSSFMSCENLEAIHCNGVFPSFKLNCLWETYTKIYFPAERPWQVSLITQLEEAFKGRIEFLASDGTDPYTPTEEAVTEITEATLVTEVTEAATEVTELPTETAPTEETAQATTEAPVETAAPKATEPARTEPVQQPQETEAPETTRSEPAEQSLLPLAVGLGALAVVLLAVILLLVLRRSGKGGKYAK